MSTTTTRPRYSKRVQRRLNRADLVIDRLDRREARIAERRLAKTTTSRSTERRAAFAAEGI